MVEANEDVLCIVEYTHFKNKCTQMYGTYRKKWPEKKRRRRLRRSKQCFCMTIEVVKADTCYEV